MPFAQGLNVARQESGLLRVWVDVRVPKTNQVFERAMTPAFKHAILIEEDTVRSDLNEREALVD